MSNSIFTLNADVKGLAEALQRSLTESTNYSKRILLVCVSVYLRPFVSNSSVCTLFSPKLLTQTSKFGPSSLQWEIAGTAGNPFGKSLGRPGLN